MLPELTKELFRKPPTITGQARLAFDQWEKGFKSFDLLIGLDHAKTVGGQFLNGWLCAKKVQDLSRNPGFLTAI